MGNLCFSLDSWCLPKFVGGGQVKCLVPGVWCAMATKLSAAPGRQMVWLTQNLNADSTLHAELCDDAQSATFKLVHDKSSLYSLLQRVLPVLLSPRVCAFQPEPVVTSSCVVVGSPQNPKHVAAVVRTTCAGAVPPTGRSGETGWRGTFKLGAWQCARAVPRYTICQKP